MINIDFLFDEHVLVKKYMSESERKKSWQNATKSLEQEWIQLFQTFINKNSFRQICKKRLHQVKNISFIPGFSCEFCEELTFESPIPSSCISSSSDFCKNIDDRFWSASISEFSLLSNFERNISSLTLSEIKINFQTSMKLSLLFLQKQIKSLFLSSLGKVLKYRLFWLLLCY